MNLLKNCITKSNIKIILAISIFLTILTAPLLHQTLPDYTCHFSLLTSIQSDIDEKFSATPYFISIIFNKDNNKIHYYN